MVWVLSSHPESETKLFIQDTTSPQLPLLFGRCLWRSPLGVTQSADCLAHAYPPPHSCGWKKEVESESTACFGLCGDIVCWITYYFGLHRVCDVMTWCLGSGIGLGSGLMLIMPLQQIRVTPAEGKQKQAEKKQNISSPDAATKVRGVLFFFYFGVFCLLDFAPIITSFKTVLLSLSEQSVTCYPEMLEKKKDRVLSYTKKYHTLPESDDYRWTITEDIRWIPSKVFKVKRKKKSTAYIFWFVTTPSL